VIHQNNFWKNNRKGNAFRGGGGGGGWGVRHGVDNVSLVVYILAQAHRQKYLDERLRESRTMGTMSDGLKLVWIKYRSRYAVKHSADTDMPEKQ